MLISRPRLECINFYQNKPKIKLILQKNTNFSSSGGGVLRPLMASDGAPRPSKQPLPSLCAYERQLAGKNNLQIAK